MGLIVSYLHENYKSLSMSTRDSSIIELPKSKEMKALKKAITKLMMTLNAKVRENEDLAGNCAG